MRYIFVDNFRGFRNSLIPIKDVNFLVGENSTGKSSILALINLLSIPQFWMSQEFNTDEFWFGGFQDIVSAEGGRKDTFRFGLLEFRRDPKSPQPLCQFFICTFREQDGQPALYKFTRMSHSRIAKLLFLRTTVRYKSTGVEMPSSEEDSLTLFDNIQKIDMNDRKGFKNLSIKSSVMRRIPSPLIGMLDSLDDFGEKKLEPSRLSFTFPAFSYNLAWLAPIRTKPRRTYDSYKASFSPEGDHTPYIIRKTLRTRTEAQQFRAALSKFGAASGLFKEVTVRAFSRDPSSPFELQVVLSTEPLNLNNVGYGVSQILPVVVEILGERGHEWFTIQQPEIHLHPRAQAAFGDLVFQVASREKKRFLIETHSDFTIDRFRLNYRKKGKKKVESQVLFFERSPKGNIAHPIPIDQEGNYDENQPSNFRDFFIREEMTLLGL